MLRRHLLLAGAGLAAPTLAAPSVLRAQAPINIRFAHSLSTSEPAHLAAEYFAKNVGEKSGGRVRIQVFPGEQLGSGRDVNEMIRSGANVMNNTDPGYLSDFVPDVGVLNGPYIVDKPEQFTKLLNSPWYADVDQRLQKAGFRVLSMGGFFGNRHMIADKPIKTPADLSGVTVRVPPNQMWLETFKALGARPATVQWSEIYNALQQGVVQAAEAPFGSIWGAKLQEVKKVISLTGHFTAIVAWPMNEGYFSKLPKEVQQILLGEGARARGRDDAADLGDGGRLHRQAEGRGRDHRRRRGPPGVQEGHAAGVLRLPEMDPRPARQDRGDPGAGVRAILLPLPFQGEGRGEGCRTPADSLALGTAVTLAKRVGVRSPSPRPSPASGRGRRGGLLPLPLAGEGRGEGAASSAGPWTCLHGSFPRAPR